jgi:hypothetical protein
MNHQKFANRLILGTVGTLVIALIAVLVAVPQSTLAQTDQQLKQYGEAAHAQDATADTITFTDKNSRKFAPAYLYIKNTGATHEVYIRIDEATATAADPSFVLAPGASIELKFPTDNMAATMSMICAAAESTSVEIRALR